MQSELSYCYICNIKKWNMNDRIALVIKAKNISPSQLADELDVQRSGVSHILNNRNKPSLEFIQKLLKSYPEISTEWLLFGEGPMMKPFLGEQAQFAPVQGIDQKPTTPKPIIMDLFADDDTDVDPEAREMDESEEQKLSEVSDKQAVEAQNRVLESSPEIVSDKNLPTSEIEKQQNRDVLRPKDEIADNSRKIMDENKKPVISRDNRQVEKVILFYSDKTFSVYNPEMEG